MIQIAELAYQASMLVWASPAALTCLPRRRQLPQGPSVCDKIAAPRGTTAESVSYDRPSVDRIGLTTYSRISRDFAGRYRSASPTYNRCVSRSLYKYIPRQHADPFVQRGEVLFRSLLYFLASEDARADELEGTHEYAPVGGLEITNHTQGWKRTTPGSSFRSSVKNPDKLFVFCTSQAFERDLAVKFGCDTCVEIADAEKFVLRLRGALRPHPRVKLNTLRCGPVKYYLTDNATETVWPLPDKIIMHKRDAFADEAEYRFAFSLKADAFKFENVNVNVTTGPTPKIPGATYPEMIVRLGPMTDCCRIHRF